MKKILLSLGLSSILLAGCSSNGYIFGDGWEDDVTKEEPKKEEITKTQKSKMQDEDIVLATEQYKVPTRPFLLNTGWKVSYINNQKINPQYSLSIYFRNNIFNEHDFLISGKSGCNSYQGNVSIEIMESKLIAETSYMSTNLYCADANLEAVEKKFLDVIFDNKSIEKNGENSIILRHYNDTFVLERI